jgi:gamma-glutamylcyclotransferase (GGCT)/AIG2-like uncharacterized protein YtfP
VRKAAKLRPESVRTVARSSGAGRTHGELLFVYGTLMRGGEIHNLLQRPGIRFVGKAKMRGELYMFKSAGYPGAVESAKNGQFVHGELYRVAEPRRRFPVLDKAEGCEEGLFERREVPVRRGSRTMRAWTYLYAKSPASGKPLAGGKFLPLRQSA